MLKFLTQLEFPQFSNIFLYICLKKMKLLVLMAISSFLFSTYSQQMLLTKVLTEQGKQLIQSLDQIRNIDKADQQIQKNKEGNKQKRDSQSFYKTSISLNQNSNEQTKQRSQLKKIVNLIDIQEQPKINKMFTGQKKLNLENIQNTPMPQYLNFQDSLVSLYKNNKVQPRQKLLGNQANQQQSEGRVSKKQILKRNKFKRESKKCIQQNCQQQFERCQQIECWKDLKKCLCRLEDKKCWQKCSQIISVAAFEMNQCLVQKGCKTAKFNEVDSE